MMVEITFKIKKTLKVPVDAPDLNPDIIVGKSLDEVRNIEIWEGNRKIKLCEIFDVNGEQADKIEELHIKIIGDVSKVKRIGQKMSGGNIQIDGNAGVYLGNKMKDGSIIVSGDAGSWLGAFMQGGMIEVKGNAGDFVGASYRGKSEGMKGGMILIHGDAGNEIGCWMKGGTIQIMGNSEGYPGTHMKNGTIYVGKNCLCRAGAQMSGGKIIIDGKIPEILPSFTIEGVRGSARLGKEKIQGPFFLFVGDGNEEGEGRLYVRKEGNDGLKYCEDYLDMEV
ncbi:MAG: formylmethanofuran dehydrogenase subunit C [Candidatus Bathyarchaeota archaeon]|nr:formylmethanofuran dehydrogenase subunit C [Candidatus Bathyarchaeota archaeon]